MRRRLFIAFASVTLAQTAFAQSVSNLAFVDSRQSFQEVSAGEPVAGDEAGILQFEVAFVSDQFDAATQSYFLHPLSAVWRVRDAGGVPLSTWPGQHEWFGFRHPAPQPQVDSFDATTGQGTLTVFVPIGTGIESDRCYPRLPAGNQDLDFAVGWAEVMTLDATGEPHGTLSQGSFPVPVAYPNEWVEVLNPRGGVGSSILCIVHATTDSTSSRDFIVGNAYQGQIEVVGGAGRTTPVTLPAGITGLALELRGVGVGDYRVELLDEQGTTLLAESAGGQIVEGYPADMVGAVLETDPDPPAVATSSSTYTVHLPAGYQGGNIKIPFEDPNGGLRKCIPPSGQDQGLQYTTCSPCSTSPQISCPDQVTFASPAACVFTFNPIASCTPSGTTQITVKLYSKTAGPYDQALGCPLIGGGLKVDIDLFEGGTSGTVQTYKKCCDYSDSGNTALATVPNCI